MDGWLTCNFTSFSIVFQSYQDDGWVLMKGSAQWNLLYSQKDFCFKRGSKLALIFVSARQHLLISNNLLVRKNYFDSNIVWNENVRTLRHFSKDYFEADAHQGATCKHFDVSDVIYHKFSHGAASYMINGENINVMLEYSVWLLATFQRIIRY